MKTKEEINIGISEFLKNARKKRRMSKSKIADLLYIDDKTWARYESGESTPNVGEFARICYELGESPLRSVLDITYSDVYEKLSPNSDVETLRQAAIKYFESIASDHTVQVINYIAFGHHGSNIEPQMQEFCMIDHLPLEYRVLIARMVRSCWDIAESKGEVICKESIMPDIELLDDAIRAGERAVLNGSIGYSTAMRK